MNVPYDFCPQIESNGRNVYTCFHCGFTLCARCMRLQFGRFSTRRSSRIRETDVQIGDEVLKLPPKYEEITRHRGRELVMFVSEHGIKFIVILMP